jgi:hypothetical protein
MSSLINFYSDRIIQGVAYPALNSWTAEPYTPEWREFGNSWPYTVPADLHEHCRAHNIPYELNSTSGYYTIALKFFDFSIDYFSIIDPQIKKRIVDNQVTVLFYYDEGDNPATIKQRLDNLCKLNQLPLDCYRFISANSRADDYKNFVYFAGDELLYWLRNRSTLPLPIHTDPRQKQFTVLSRTHKYWRAIIMADLYRTGVLDNSYWSYHTEVTLNETVWDSPILVWWFNNLIDDVAEFLDNAPYACDSTTSAEQNDHTLLQPEHYNDSYCSIILETHFDADRSDGTFITEKTFKAIKHGQPFVIAGPHGSLAKLRELGYRTFDHAIDNSYDLEVNPTQRYIKLKHAIDQIRSQDMHTWFESCLNDLQYNQELFVRSKQDRLNMLFSKLSKI